MAANVTPGPGEDEDTNPEVNPAGGRRRFPYPWGLMVALVAYALLVTGFLQWRYWSSPEYQAIQHWERASELTGPDQGRGTATPQLQEAYREALEAALLAPKALEPQRLLETLTWRFDERRVALQPEWKAKAAAVGVSHRRAIEAEDPLLVTGLRDQGWTPDEVLAAPRKVALWSVLGGIVIIGLWAYGRYNELRVHAEEKEAYRKQTEAEVRELARVRDGLKNQGVPRE